MDSLKINVIETMTKKWDIMRMLRLVVGFWGVYVSIEDRQLVFGILGGVFILQSLLNIGCCGNGSCKISQNQNHRLNNIKESSYEEVSR